MPYLFCFSSFSDERINNKPVMIEAEIVMKPNVRIFQVSVMPPNIDDNTTAVVIYLEISINHLPNSFFISFQYFAAKVQRKSETAKCLAEFLVICSYVNKLKSDEARAEQQARLIAMPSRGCYFSEAKERFFSSTDYHRLTQIIIINQ